MAAASTPLLLKIQKGLFVSLCLDVSEASSRGERRIASFTTACSRILSIGKGSKRRQEQEQARERERERERTVLDRKGKKKAAAPRPASKFWNSSTGFHSFFLLHFIVPKS